MFGSKKKQEKERQDAARSQALVSWFDALAAARPVGAGALTDDLLAQVGNPYAGLPPRGTADGDLAFATEQALGRMLADQRSRQAIIQDDPDHLSQHHFWMSVSAWM